MSAPPKSSLKDTFPERLISISSLMIFFHPQKARLKRRGRYMFIAGAGVGRLPPLLSLPKKAFRW